MASRIIQGNVFDVLPTLPRGSVDCAVTSPPYWQLRSYLPADHPLKRFELGSEPTPQEYVANMVRVFGLVREVMADHATLWLNIGDSYARDGGTGCCGPNAKVGNTQSGKQVRNCAAPNGIPAGNLCLIPWRLAIALQDNGWIVRSVICWHKPSAMPASIKGWMWVRCQVKVASGNQIGSGKQAGNRLTAGFNERCGTTKKQEHGHAAQSNGAFLPKAQWADCPGCKKCEKHGGYVLRRGSWRPTSSWEPVLMLAKTDRYFCDGEAVKTTPAAATVERDKYTRILDDPDEQFAVAHDHETICTGANLRDVWTICSEPLKAKHYAAYPTELVYRALAAGTSSKGYCPACGSPWVRVVEQEDTGRTQKMADNWDTGEGGHGSFHRNGSEEGERGKPVMTSKTIGWKQSCTCPAAEPRPGLVLDPFSGSGRTAIQCGRMGLDFVGVDLNEEYCEMSRRLITEANPLFG